MQYGESAMVDVYSKSSKDFVQFLVEGDPRYTTDIQELTLPVGYLQSFFDKHACIWKSTLNCHTMGEWCPI